MLCLLALVSIVAGAAKGLTGFGGALVMAPFFSSMLPANAVGALVVIVHCATSMQGIRRWRCETRWAAVMPLARRAVGVVVMIVTIAHISGWRWRHTGGWWATVTASALSGTLTALGGLGRPPAVYYFNGLTQGVTLKANLLGYFAVLFGGAAFLLLIEGGVSGSLLVTALVLIPPFAAGVAVGERYSLTLPRRALEIAMSVLLLSSSLIAIFS